MIDEELMKQLKETILKTLNNGIAYTHMTELERDEKEQEIVEHLKSKGYDVFIEECMIYVLGKQWSRILMMELTRNTLYFTPFKVSEVSEVVFYILQLVSKKYLDSMPKVEPKASEKEEEIEEDTDEDTEEDPKPPPDFSFL